MANESTFDLPVAELVAANGALANYRTGSDDPDLSNLAQSIRELGQLQPVLVAQTPTGWVLAAGFRRVAAVMTLGQPTVRAQEVPADRVDLIRLAENFDRQDPTSYETCRYLYELNRGRDGARKRTHGEIAQAVGLSATHVGNLIRFYRDAPAQLREAWKQDRDQRFTFAALNAIVTKAKRREDFGGVLGRVLGHEAPKPSAALPIDGEGNTSKPKPSKSGTRRLGRTGAERLACTLAEVGQDRLKTDERAVILLEVLGAVAGHVPASRIKERVEAILGDLGVTPPTKPSASAGQFDLERGWS